MLWSAPWVYCYYKETHTRRHRTIWQKEVNTVEAFPALLPPLDCWRKIAEYFERIPPKRQHLAESAYKKQLSVTRRRRPQTVSVLMNGGGRGVAGDWGGGVSRPSGIMTREESTISKTPRCGQLAACWHLLSIFCPVCPPPALLLCSLRFLPGCCPVAVAALLCLCCFLLWTLEVLLLCVPRTAAVPGRFCSARFLLGKTDDIMVYDISVAP